MRGEKIKKLMTTKNEQKLIKLAKGLDFNTPFEYLDYCVISYINGNMSQCRSLFATLNTKELKKQLLGYIMTNYPTYKDVYTFYFNLL
jgi:hypothetical protein